MSYEISSVKSTQIDTLKNFTSPRIRDATDTQISKTLINVYFLIGLRPNHYPTKEEDKFILSYLRTKYGHRQLEELTMAFDLAINKFLDVEDVRVFDQFSIEYLVRIMQAYGRYASRLIVEMKPKVIETKQLPLPTNIEEMTSELEYWKQKQDLKFEVIPLYLYTYLKDLRLIDDVSDIKLNTRAAIVRLKQLRNLCNPGTKDDRRNFNDFNQMYEDGVIEGREFNIVSNLAKRLVIADWLKANREG